MNNLDNLQEKIGYKFKNLDLLVQALTHQSYANDNSTISYERLEFLGDAVIELIALVFDLNFKESFEILKEEQYIDRITKRFNSKDKNTKNVLEETRRKINQFIDRKIKAS